MTSPTKVVVTALVALTTFAVGAYISLQAAGMGHGNYLPMGLCFPFGILAAAVLRGQDWAIPVVSTLQFLGYGIVFSRGWIRGKAKMTGLKIGVFHAAGALVFLVMFFLG